MINQPLLMYDEVRYWLWMQMLTFTICGPLIHVTVVDGCLCTVIPCMFYFSAIESDRAVGLLKP